MKKIIKILGVCLTICIIAACSQTLDQKQSSKETRIGGVILPHHNLVGNYIDEFYKQLSETENYQSIILLSTNHFDFGHHFIQSANNLPTPLKLDLEFINKLDQSDILSVEKGNLDAEHGIFVHTERIEKYFPEATLIPITMKWKTPQENLDKLIEAIRSKGPLENTLIVASIDFSHFVKEETAAANDDRTKEWLEDWGDGKNTDLSLQTFIELEKSISMDTDTATALDSPETLYVLTNLLGIPQNVEIWRRTSSHSMFDIKDPLQNTSHLFVKIHK